MRQLTEIGIEPIQKFNVVGENNEQIELKLMYKPTQESWYFDIVYGDFVLNGQKIVSSPNLLKQYENLLPFGISCVVEDGSEPYFINDFFTGRATLNLLTKEDIETIEAILLSWALKNLAEIID